MSWITAGQDDDVQKTERYQSLKRDLHRFLIQVIESEELDLESWSEDRMRQYVDARIDDFLASNRLAVNRREVDALGRDMLDELRGYGPIQTFIDRDDISDILVNGYGSIYIERRGQLVETERRFIDDDHLLRVIQRILAPIGRRVDESTPMVDARLPDGGRVNAIIPPLALNGPTLSIRKFQREALQSGDLLAYRTLNDEMVEFLRRAVEAQCNILVVGGTGSGKTTLLNILSGYIPEDARIITVEDAAELQLHHPHVVRLETRPPNLEGEGEITARELVRNSLRMRPDRVIVGEVRGVEILDMLQAMSTGHDGSMGTLHANSPRDALHRMEMLAGFAGYQGSEHTLRLQVSNAIDLIVQLDRTASGDRRVTSIQEITGVNDNTYMMQELFSYDQENDQFIRQSIQPSSHKLQAHESLQRRQSPFAPGGRG
ncbi:CpaF family protein [uncultured Halovibrio sp.]|uniref:CpaF family protein n=1 Tax=uncultured Halovibrio sp. TaxID=985049 RepID=UPI0025D6FB52|nr:CpaF family protein [uncultured Halovibrio sp.]